MIIVDAVCSRVYDSVTSINVPSLLTIDNDYSPGGNYINDGGDFLWDSGNYIGVPGFTANYVTYLDNCEVGNVNGNNYSMNMNNSGLSVTWFNNYGQDSISIDGEYSDVVSVSHASYQYNEWKGFWKISYNFHYSNVSDHDDDDPIFGHFWVTNSPTAVHVPYLYNIWEMNDEIMMSIVWSL